MSFNNDGKNKDDKETLYMSLLDESDSEEIRPDAQKLADSNISGNNNGIEQIDFDDPRFLALIAQMNDTINPKKQDMLLANNGYSIPITFSAHYQSGNDKDREKDIREILNFIKSNYIFVNFSDSLLLWSNGSYNPISSQDFLIFCRQRLPEKFRFIRDNNGKLVYSMLVADARKIDDQHFDNCSHYITFLDFNYNVIDQQLYPHTPSIYTMGTIPAYYKSCSNSMRPDNFLQYVNLISNGDPAMFNYIFENIGYWISNFFLKRCDILIGERNSGKSTLLRFVEYLIGEQYVSNISLHDLGRKYATAELHGKKLNNGGEMSSITLKDDGLFKMLTGRDKITARKIYGSPFTFISRAKMVFCTNELQNIKIVNSDTDAVRRRINIINFSGSIPEKDIDVNILQKFKMEKDGVIWLAINALSRPCNNNFQFTPYAKGIEINIELDRIIDPTLALLRDFIDIHCDIKPHLVILVEKFVNEFNDVMRQNLSVDSFSKKYRSRLMVEYGLTKGKRRMNTQNPQTVLIGIDLL